MRVHHEAISEIDRYLADNRSLRLEDNEATFENYLRTLRRYRTIDGDTAILEIGTGTGWFPLLCMLKGLRCKGLEISPQLVEHARQLGRQYGLLPDIELGNIEDTDLGSDRYDLIVASSVFEHVENWKEGVRRVYRALRPGGVLYFESTNKFSFSSGEYHFPLYGWLPNRWRYRLRMARQGEDIMKLGIDFHQFTHAGLRREFKRVGFSRVLDRVQAADERFVSSTWRKAVVCASKRLPPVRALALLFADATRFVCIK